METERTTEDLFESLSPEARVEAIRLAARLQDRGAESRDLLAAARESGLDDAHLRAAALRVGSGPVPTPTHGTRQEPAPWLTLSLERWTDRTLVLRHSTGLLSLLAIAQIYPGFVSHNELTYVSLWPFFLLTTVLVAAVARLVPKTLGLKVVAGVWLMMLAANFIVSMGAHFRFPLSKSETLMLANAAKSLGFALLGLVLAGLVTSPRERASAASSPQA